MPRGLLFILKLSVQAYHYDAFHSCQTNLYNLIVLLLYTSHVCFYIGHNLKDVLFAATWWTPYSQWGALYNTPGWHPRIGAGRNASLCNCVCGRCLCVQFCVPETVYKNNDVCTKGLLEIQDRTPTPKPVLQLLSSLNAYPKSDKFWMLTLLVSDSFPLFFVPWIVPISAWGWNVMTCVLLILYFLW